MYGEIEARLMVPDILEWGNYQWTWPPKDLDIDNLGVSRGLVGQREGLAMAMVMSGERDRVDVPAIKNLYKAFSEISIADPDELTKSDRGLLSSLRDSLHEWFLDGRWVFQPYPDTGNASESGSPEDTRFHRLLLPAQMMNTLTKLATNGSIDDVGRGSLIQLSDAAYISGVRCLKDDYLSTITSRVAGLKDRSVSVGNNISYSHDLQRLIDNKMDIHGLSENAGRVFDSSYNSTINNLQDGNLAAGLYFMKSVVIGVMQEWHQERLGIPYMIPSIARQPQTRDGHTPYAFQNNSTNRAGDMHTNNHRFPFQRYVAHHMRTSVL